jgi:hypothetical protein
VTARLREFALSLVGAAVVAFLALPPLAFDRALRSAVYAELPLPPAWVFWIGLALGAVGLLASVVLFIRKADAANPGYRICAMVAVTLVFLQLVVLSSFAKPNEAPAGAITALKRFGDAVAKEPREYLPASVAELTPYVNDLPPPLYLEHGKQPPRFGVGVTLGCSGPVGEAGGNPPGTILYCVSNDRKSAWATVVGLDGPAGKPSVLFPQEMFYPFEAASSGADAGGPPRAIGSDGGLTNGGGSIEPTLLDAGVER